MKLLRLAAVGTSASAAVAQTGVLLPATPFQPGFNLLAVIDTKGMTGAPVIKVQESADLAFTTPVDVTGAATSGILADQWVFEFTPTLPYVRTIVSTAAGAGTYQAYLLAGGAP